MDRDLAMVSDPLRLRMMGSHSFSKSGSHRPRR
jgi:hypothetical protein